MKCADLGSLLGAWLLASALGHSFVAMADETSPSLVGLDHIPLAVRDLEDAANTYGQLGFALKPGRFHPNGIRNQHIKFVDGTGIELITAPKDTDADTAEYVRLLAQGEGPAFLALHTADISALTKRFDAIKQAYAREGSFVKVLAPAFRLFFFYQGDNRSPTDKPEHFAHANTANDLIGVWLASNDTAELCTLFRATGAAISKRKVFVPEAAKA